MARTLKLTPASAPGPGLPPGPALVLPIRGMTCAACVGAVEHALKGVPGVAAAHVSLATEEATVVVDPGAPPAVDALRRAVSDAGYEALAPVDDDLPGAALELAAARAREDKALTTALVASAVLALVVMALDLPKMARGHAGISTFDFMQMLLALPVQFVCGARFYRGAWAALRHRRADMNTLIALGTSAAFLVSAFVTLAPAAAALGIPPKTFFDTSSAIITLVLLGKWLEARAKRRTGSALAALLAFRPERARVERDGGVVDVAAAEVREGETFVLRPGDRVPVDGVVIEGHSSVDESWLTGESLPLEKAPGAGLLAGSVNSEGALRARALGVGGQTALARVVRFVREAQGSRAPIQALADRVSGVFVPVVLLVALATLVTWLLVDPTVALARAVAVLVIACPCALGLATPTALAVGMGRAADAGILIKHGAALERAGAIDTVVFDKTGTLTRGRPDVAAFEALPGVDVREALALAAGADAASEHPYARAIVRHARSLGIEPLAVTAFRAVPGRGARAEIGGDIVRVGSPAFLHAEGIDLASVATKVEHLGDAGRAVLVVARGLSPIALVALADSVKEDAAPEVARLIRAGIRPVLLTGDAEAPARAIARVVGIEDVRAGVAPEDKARTLLALQREGRSVAMVGDGVNDAPALAAADLGIALGTGSDVALDAADVTLLRGDLAGVHRALLLARRTVLTIRRNLFWAFVYNVIGIPLAAGVFTPLALDPMFAAGAMALSSLSVLASSLRLGRTQLD